MSTVLRPPPPLGYRFRPSDEEIIKYSLIPKIQGRTLPGNHIFETTEIYGKGLKDLETTFKKGKEWYRRYASFDENADDSLYFFTKLKKKWEKSSRISRISGGGTWTGEKGNEIYRDKSYRVKKRDLTFTVNGVRKIPTRDGYVTWNMEEYSIEKHEINLDYAIVKIKKKISKKDKAADVAVQGGPDVVEVDDAVPEEQPAAADNKMQCQLPNTNGAGHWQNTGIFFGNLVPVGAVVFPTAVDNHLQYQPSSSTTVSTNGNSTIPYYPAVKELDAGTFQAFSSSPVLQDAVLPIQQQLQSWGYPISYNIPNDQVPLLVYPCYLYSLPSGYQHETAVPTPNDSRQEKNNLDASVYSLQAAVGPVAAVYFRAIGGDNAAVQDHNQEGSNDTSVASSEVETGQPQKK